MPSLVNVQESPKMVKRTSSFNRSDSFDYRRAAPRPPPSRSDSGSHSLNGTYGEYRNGSEEHRDEYSQPETNGKFKGSQTSLKSDEGSQGSFQSFRSEPVQRHSLMSLQEKRGSYASLNGRSKTATLPRGYGSTREKNWEEYWAQWVFTIMFFVSLDSFYISINVIVITIFFLCVNLIYVYNLLVSVRTKLNSQSQPIVMKFWGFCRSENSITFISYSPIFYPRTNLYGKTMFSGASN